MSGRTSTRARVVVFGALATLVLLLAFSTPRGVILRSVGGLLVVGDPVAPSDIAVMTTEDQLGNALELANLLQQHVVDRVGVITSTVSPAHRELTRRGVTITDGPDILRQLGVPADAIVEIDGGEGGTNQGTGALAAWCAEHHIRRLIVVTSPDHSRRVRRTLVRSFRAAHAAPPIIQIHSSSFSQFHSADWWQSRTTLRVGIVELEKLLLEYVQHPLAG